MITRTFLLPFIVCSGVLAAAACKPGGSDSTSSSGAGAGPNEPDEPVISCPVSEGPTEHNGVEASETWTAKGSPHIVSFPITVGEGVTLTIEPCAEVLFQKDAGIVVKNGGALIAEGTKTAPITFRGQDEARWSEVHVQHPGKAVLRHVTMKGGGSDGFHNHATLYVRGDTETPAKRPVLVDHVTIEGSEGAGLVVDWAGALDAASTDLVITGSGGDEMPYPVVVGEHAIGSLPKGSYTGNRKDGILIDDEGANQASGLQEDTLMRDLGVPWHVDDWAGAKLRIGKGGSDAPSLTTLTIEPGVTIKFRPGNWFEIEHYTGEFAASGALVAVGTPDKPIVFTSDAENPQPGDWGGLWYGGIPRASNVLENVRIEYAGYDCGCILLSCNDVEAYEGAVIFSQPPPTAFISNTTIAHVAGHGVVRGWRGPAGPDFTPSNSFEDVSGCAQTRPELDGVPCPKPRPTCPE